MITAFSAEGILDRMAQAIRSGDQSLEALLADYDDFKRGYRVSEQGFEIPLTQGFWSLVDEDDLPRVLNHKWFAAGEGTLATPMVARAKIAGRGVALARFILKLEVGDPLIADHINFNTLDNRKENLRAVTKIESAQHRRAWSRQGDHEKSQFKGVYRVGARWRAVIKDNKKPIHIGYFLDEEVAARAYDAAAKELHKEYAELNYG